MLWKKESCGPDALYTDIFTPNTQHWNSILNSELQTIVQTLHLEKSETIAWEKRNEGNVKFHDTKPLKAMEFYNDSLRFANPGSEHISLAYANRAACYLAMRMYDECLKDIDLAKQAGYPEHLMPKLEQRMARCLKEMPKNSQNQEKLSIEPNEQFPYLSNVAEIQRNGVNGDYCVIAKTDIDVGQPIVVEEPFYAHIWDGFGMHCNICAEVYGNLVPCEKCAAAMFCPECQGHFLHEHECGLYFCGKSEFNCHIMSLVRGILLALKLFATVDELMEFVEQLLKKPNELPESLLNGRSMYQAYFNKPLKQTFTSHNRIEQKIFSVYKTLLRIPHVNEMVKTTVHRRFLTHLIGHHATIPQCIAGFIIGSDSLSPIRPPIRVNPVTRSYFKHSCIENVKFITNGGKSTAFSLKPIKKGEQLFVSYVPQRMNSTKERKKFIRDVLKLNCKCARCQDKIASPVERQQLVADSVFCYIDANVKSLHPLQFNSKEVKALLGACVSVLQKYGQMDWCDELDFVSDLLILLSKIRSIGGGADFNHPLAHEFLSHCDG